MGRNALKLCTSEVGPFGQNADIAVLDMGDCNCVFFFALVRIMEKENLVRPV